MTTCQGLLQGGLWLALLAGSAVAQQAPAPKALFDGKSLDGWSVVSGQATYRVEDGAIVGKTTRGSGNTFLVTGPFKDFLLEADVKVDSRLNSGIQVRSHLYEEGSEGAKAHGVGRLYGPQVEISTDGNAGRIYDEARQGQWIDANGPLSDEAARAFKADEWNHYRILVQGNRYRVWVNGVPTCDVTDDRDTEGLIGLQVHGIAPWAGPYEVRWKNLTILELEPGQEAPAPK